MDNKQKRVHKEESASYQSRQSTTLVSEERKDEVNLNLVIPQQNYLLKQVRKARKALSSSSSKPCQFSSDQPVVEKARQEYQRPLFSSWMHAHKRSDERPSTKIEDSSRKSDNSISDGGRQEEKEIKIQNYDLENKDACKNIDPSTYSKNATGVKSMSDISLSNEGKNSFDNSFISDHVTQPLEIESTSGKSHNPRFDDGRLEKEGMRVQSFYLDKNRGACGSLDGQGISASAVKYMSKDLTPDIHNMPPDVCSASPDVRSASSDVRSASSDVRSASPDVRSASPDTRNMATNSNNLQKGSAFSGCANAPRNIYPYTVPSRSNLHSYSSAYAPPYSRDISLDNMPVQSSNSKGYSSSGRGTVSKNISTHNVPAQSSQLQEVPLSSGLLTASINVNDQTASSKCNNLTAVLATSACSEQSGKPIKVSKKPSSNEKLQIMGNVENVPQTSAVLQSDPSNPLNTNLTDWVVFESNQHGKESHVGFATEPHFLDSRGHHETKNVKLQNANLDNIQTQLQFISREEQIDQPDMFAVKANVIYNWLRKLPKEQAEEAEKKIACILYQSEVDAGKRKSQTNINYLCRPPVEKMCEERFSSSQKSPSPRNEREGAVKSPKSQNLYLQLHPEEEEEYFNEQNNTELYDPYNEYPSDEEESEEEVVKVKKPARLRKRVHDVPECSERQKPKQHKEKTSPTPPPPYIYMKQVLLVLLVMLSTAATGFFGATFWPKIVETFQEMNTPPPIDIDTIIENLKIDFDEQPPMTFKIVSSALRRVTEPDPKEPAIIVLLAEQGAEDIASRLARKIANYVASPSDVVLISGHTYYNQDHDTAKKDIDLLINDNLREDKLGAVLVERLDYIPAEAAIIFHTYCDHENAPFKRTVYVMTIASKKTQLKLHEPKDWDAIVQEHLYGSWSTFGEDQISSLLSRLTVSVAAIVSGG